MNLIEVHVNRVHGGCEDFFKINKKIIN